MDFNTHAVNRPAGADLMIYISLIAVIGIMLLQASGAVPLSSVGGPMTLALAFFAAAMAVGIHEAWTKKRGVFGWIVNIVVSFVGAFFGAQIGGMIFMIVLMLLSPFVEMNGSLAATGGPLLFIALAVTMLATVWGSWGALWIVNRWRDKPTPNSTGAAAGS